MTTSRRDFMKLSAAAGGVLGLRGMPTSLLGPARRRGHEYEGLPDVPAADRPLRVLILGGTGFIGPYEVRYAVARGHAVTVFNRGRHQADLPASVEHLVGDRNGDLQSLEGRDWDVVVDNPTTLPKWVRDSASLLAGHAGQYVFISSISVYADTSEPGMDEDTPVLPYQGSDPYAETHVTAQLYGPLKALSEKEAEKWFPGKTTVIRPGLIVGPGDPSDRFTYWPVRIDRGGEVMAPGEPTGPAQIIDARDLSEWTVRVCEQADMGVYNATGPRAPLSFAEMLYGCRAVTSGSNDIRFTWVDSDFLAAQQVSAWSEMPVWVPDTPENAGFARVSIERAVAKGLTFRPLAVTARDALDWFKTLPVERQAKLLSGIDPVKEKRALQAWHARA